MPSLYSSLSDHNCKLYQQVDLQRFRLVQVLILILFRCPKNAPAQPRFYSDTNCPSNILFGSNRYKNKYQIFEQVDHSAKRCSKFKFLEVVANCTSVSFNKDVIRLTNLAASHSIISGHFNPHSEYDNIDELILGDS